MLFHDDLSATLPLPSQYFCLRKKYYKFPPILLMYSTTVFTQHTCSPSVEQMARQFLLGIDSVPCRLFILNIVSLLLLSQLESRLLKG